MDSRRRDTADSLYSPVGTAEKVSSALLFMSLGLSFLVLLIPQNLRLVAEIAQVLFALTVVANFVLAHAIRLYWGPRAHRRRVDDLVSHTFNAPIIDEPSVGYYNTKEIEAGRRLNAAVLENTFFGSAIVAAMLRWERGSIAVYLLLWFGALFFRGTEISWLIVASQVLFGEQLLSRWLRVEFLRSQMEAIYKASFQLAKMSIPLDELLPRALQNLVHYELAKAHAGVSLSSKVFKKINPKLSKTWAALEKDL